MPGVHDQHAQGDEPVLGKILLHELRPSLLLRHGHLGIAVARQIHQVGLLVQQEIVDVHGLPRGLAHPRKIFALEHPVDDRALAHIGLAGEDDLRQAVAAEVGGSGRRKHEFHVMQIHRRLTDGCRGPASSNP